MRLGFRALKRLRDLYGNVLRKCLLLNHSRMAYPADLHRRAVAAVAEQLEPRLLLSGPPTVTSLHSDNEDLTLPGDASVATDDLRVAFSRDMDPATLLSASNWTLISDGGDGTLDDGSDAAHALTTSCRSRSALRPSGRSSIIIMKSNPFVVYRL